MNQLVVRESARLSLSWSSKTTQFIWGATTPMLGIMRDLVLLSQAVGHSQMQVRCVVERPDIRRRILLSVSSVMEVFEWDLLDEHDSAPRVLSMTPVSTIEIHTDNPSPCDSDSDIIPDVDITATLAPDESSWQPKYRYEYNYSVTYYIADHVRSKVSVGPHFGLMPLQESSDYDIDGAILKLNSRYLKKHIWTPLLFATCLLVKALEVSSADLGQLIGTL